MAKVIDYAVLALLLGIIALAHSLLPQNQLPHCPKGTINCPVDKL